MAPYSRNVASYIKNTQDLVDKVRNWNMQEDEVLVSFDVKSLFTSVPVDEAMKAVNKRLVEDVDLRERTGLNPETVMDMLNLCLQNRQFQFRETHY